MVETHFEKLTVPPGRFSGVYLGDMIDTNVLVNRFVLRQKGVDPDAVRVEYDPSYVGASAYPPGTIIIGPRALNLMERKPEYAYVLMAHELTHLIQPEPTVMQYISVHGTPTMIHSRSVREQEAEYWEGLQAAKFGWGREEYDAWIAELYTIIDVPSKYQTRVNIEKRERPYAALPVLSRRPRSGAPTQPSDISPDVRVRRHRRRA